MHHTSNSLLFWLKKKKINTSISPCLYMYPNLELTFMAAQTHLHLHLVDHGSAAGQQSRPYSADTCDDISIASSGMHGLGQVDGTSQYLGLDQIQPHLPYSMTSH
jgi:hypothetical protein